MFTSVASAMIALAIELLPRKITLSIHVLVQQYLYSGVARESQRGYAWSLYNFGFSGQAFGFLMLLQDKLKSWHPKCFSDYASVMPTLSSLLHFKFEHR